MLSLLFSIVSLVSANCVETYERDKKDMVCPNGTTLQDGYCQVGIQNFVDKVCPNGFIKMRAKDKCLEICKSGYQPVEFQCQKTVKDYDSKKKDMVCPSGSEVQKSSGYCYNTSKNKYFNKVCPNGSTIYRGNCYENCKPGYTLTSYGSRCSCKN